LVQFVFNHFACASFKYTLFKKNVKYFPEYFLSIVEQLDKIVFKIYIIFVFISKFIHFKKQA